MKDRCLNERNPKFNLWGGAGVKVCARWQHFGEFFADMGERPAGMTLDRWPNRDGDYEPRNCRWATRAQQSNNLRTTRFFDGKTISEWAHEWGCSRDAIKLRLRRGQTFEYIAATLGH